VSKHTCHWAGCGKAVPPKLWGCKEHWFRLPSHLRARIWATYAAAAPWPMPQQTKEK
jgi:hypothetical protein